LVRGDFFDATPPASFTEDFILRTAILIPLHWQFAFVCTLLRSL
jgi:hypothetical protein